MNIEGDYVNGPRRRQKCLALGTLVVGFTLPLWLVAEAQETQRAASI